MAKQILINVVSDNGLLPDGAKPLPEPILKFHLGCDENNLRAIWQDIPQQIIAKLRLKITYSKIYSHLREDNDLKYIYYTGSRCDSSPWKKVSIR